MTRDSKLLTVSVATQPHCQLHPPPPLMTPHASVVRNRKNCTSENDQSITRGTVKSTSRYLTVYLFACDGSPVQDG